jgi:hypothetical protein
MRRVIPMQLERLASLLHRAREFLDRLGRDALEQDTLVSVGAGESAVVVLTARGEASYELSVN